MSISVKILQIFYTWIRVFTVLDIMKNYHKLLIVCKYVDVRKVVGSTIEAPAVHVIAERECQRRFGSKKEVKRLKGIVIRAYSVKKRGQATTTIEAEDDLTTSDKKQRKMSLTI